MREYGGYIEFEYYHGSEYHKDAIALNSGRHCVEYLIRAKSIRKLYIPYFMCDSVSNLCKKLGIEVECYHTDIHFLPRFERILAEGEWLYIVNFYGQITDDVLKQFKIKYDHIIVDNVQDFFRKPLEDVDACYSCRKFFGVADGGYLYTDQKINTLLSQDYSYDRMQFLFGRMEKSANEFYAQYIANNRLFAGEPLKRMSKLTKNLMRGIDYEHVKRVRTENFAYLHTRLRAINRLELIVPDGAFMYPLYIENGEEIRKRLQEKRIYIPTLWPDVFKRCLENELEYDMAKNILPLPVDQRYERADMDVIEVEVMECIS